MIAVLLSILALALIPVLAVVSWRRLGRAAIPLTLMAIMAATGSMHEVFEQWIPGGVVAVNLFRGRYAEWSVPTHDWPWSLLAACLPGLLAIIGVLWAILAIRRMPSW